jgi:hypothetical protein
LQLVAVVQVAVGFMGLAVAVQVDSLLAGLL